MEDPNTPGFDPLVKAQVILPHKEVTWWPW
jgi:hypothetical protein